MSFFESSLRVHDFDPPPFGAAFSFEDLPKEAPLMPDPLLRGDCDRCAALCCVALAFDRSESFAFDKAANAPCRNLDAGNRCSLHAHLTTAGFGGCAAYDCYGAGQVVTQEIFGGRSWRDEPGLLPVMMEAFRALRGLHELRLLLREARMLPLDAGEVRQLAAFERTLEADGGWTVSGLRAFEQSGLSGRIRSFLRGLGATRQRMCRPGRDDVAA